VQRLMAVYNLMTGSESEAIAIGGGTYARTMPNIVAFGPTFPGEPDVCHQVDESITVDKLLSSAAIYREALRELSR
jgi:succinyl-diaminopimelate desuccinylase